MPDRFAGRALTAALLCCLFLLAAGSLQAAFDAVEHEKAADAILCDCGCHPQSVYDCACGRAAQMREEIAQLIEHGPEGGDGASMSGDAVIAWYVEKFGAKVLVTPTASGFNLVAWVGPLVGLLATTGLLFMLLRRWSAHAAAAPQPAAATPVAADDPYLSRLRDELEKLE